jgi:hypothetical protein
MGTADEMALDMLINSLDTFSMECVSFYLCRVAAGRALTGDDRAEEYCKGHAAGVASVNVAEIERAAKYAALCELFGESYKVPDFQAYTFTRAQILIALTRYAPPTPEPARRVWTRPSDRESFRTRDGETWESIKESINPGKWMTYTTVLPVSYSRADFDSLAAFLNEHFTTPEVPK